MDLLLLPHGAAYLLCIKFETNFIISDTPDKEKARQ